MVQLTTIEEQLKVIGADFKLWGRSEVVELQNILFDDEQIKGCLNGRYEGGFALLCATDQRLLLIDKKPFFLSIEDIRYDMIAEVDYSHHMIDASIKVCTPNKTLHFRAFKQANLRQLSAYVQKRVMEMRQQHMFEPYLASPVPDTSVPQPVLSPIAAGFAGAGATAGVGAGVIPLQYRITNPYTKVPLMVRRRVGRFSH